MIIHFALDLDGMQPAPPRTAVGEIALGPGRLVALLEAQLGLPPVEAHPGEALLAYRDCLEALDDDERFYHRSFATDPIGTARTLLGWRARWHEAGWRGAFDGRVSRRIADMAAVEHLARERVPLDAGQRLQRIHAALAAGLATQIERIVLHDEPAVFPPAWRAVLARFPVEIAQGVAARANATPGTDLHRIQQLLLSIGADGEAAGRQDDGSAVGRAAAHSRAALDLAGDDSFLVVRAVSRDLSAQSIAEYLRERLSVGALESGSGTGSGSAGGGAPIDGTVLIAEHDGIIVDNALERVGLPRAGFQHYSRFRAVTQVLKLSLGLVWEPVSPQLLLQLLLHPVGPLPRFVRSALAEAVAGEPGVGGRAWRHTLDELARRLRERAESEGRPELAEDAESLAADIRYWLEAERYSSVEGAPVAAIIERAQRCASWLAGRLNAGLPDRAERDLYAAAFAQSEALLAALATLADRGGTSPGRDGASREPSSSSLDRSALIDRITLDRLLDEITSAAPDPATFAQAGHVRAATKPAAITSPWDTVIWWDLREQPSPAAHAWSETEMAELAAHGVMLPTAADRLRRESRAWRRPILAARSRAILVVHDRDEGRHPLLIQLESLARGFNEVRIEDALLAPDAATASAEKIRGLTIATEPLELHELPGRRRWWRLPSHCNLPPREQESYSSLQKLLCHPHEWVLSYAARLRTGRAANLARGSLLYGNLAHRLFETYFGRHPDRASRREADVGRWLAATLPELIRREAAVLLEPGMGVAREGIVATLEHALRQLLHHLDSAGIERVVAESRHEVAFRSVPFNGGRHDIRLCGSIDLLLVDGAGREIVVDVKWAGEDRRGSELAENRALQLATYAYMRHAATHEPAPIPAKPSSMSARRSATRADTGRSRNLELALERPGRWPEQAYFIVTTGNMLARDARIFPEALVFAPELAESTEHLWARVGRSIDWRWAQLCAGHIEVNAEGTEADEDSEPPADAYAVASTADRFDEFTWLTGWDEGI
jgi:hypothetical protein